ncbi:MAG: hypothetical protein ACKVON_07360 [Beijerinckiaceae bacterium]
MIIFYRYRKIISSACMVISIEKSVIFSDFSMIRIFHSSVNNRGECAASFLRFTAVQVKMRSGISGSVFEGLMDKNLALQRRFKGSDVTMEVAEFFSRLSCLAFPVLPFRRFSAIGIFAATQLIVQFHRGRELRSG